jgi:hypothetical protein
MWRAIPDENEKQREVAGVSVLDPDAIIRKAEAFNLFFIAKRRVNEQVRFLFSRYSVLSLTLLLRRGSCLLGAGRRIPFRPPD